MLLTNRLITLALAAVATAATAMAADIQQHPALSPQPQQVSWLNGSVPATTKITTGVRGDKALRRWAKKIPHHAEGYYLSVTPEGIVVAGADSAGLFYGQQTLRQLQHGDSVACAEVTDWPVMPERGVIEGYYGNPYSHDARLRLFEFMGRNKLNVFVYGPKDDPYHRSQWRASYPKDAAHQLKALVEAARRNHVKFVWAIHPGGDIRWERADSVALVRKCESMYELGVRSFCVFFDDISGEGARGEKQAGLLNYLNEAFAKRHDDVDALMMCPTQYNKGWSGGDYLTTLGTQMDASVRVMWTGATVVDMIDREDMEWINAQLGRKAYIWLNYPVTDYCIDHLLMGPTYGNAADIGTMVSGFCSNPMEYCEASKLSLFSIADYCWNPEAYDPQASWLLATERMVPAEVEAFRMFCDNNVDLGPTAHGLRRERESQGFVSAGDNAKAQAAYLSEMGRAATRLERGDVPQELWREIEPWVKSMNLTSGRGMMALLMARQLEDGNAEAFVQLYERYARATEEQQALRSRDFHGSIKVATPVVATRHIEPWLRQHVADLVADYKSRFDYRLDVFPQLALENGTYFIRDAAGRYLTDPDYNSPGVKAVFRTERDTINPQSQEWTVAYNGVTGRYSIINNQARRYLNELGTFGRNAFSEEWNTYEIQQSAPTSPAHDTTPSSGSNSDTSHTTPSSGSVPGGMSAGFYSIRNGGRGGHAWWIATTDDEAITYVDEAPAAETVFTWVFQPIGK